MKKFIVNGGKELAGEVKVSGSKNASLPIIFACILTNGVSEIENLPDIGDVRVALGLLSSFGAEIDRRGDKTYIDTRRLTYITPDASLVESIRASTYLIGACLSRFGVCPIMRFGGCNFSLRPIDMHIHAAESMGASYTEGKMTCQALGGGEINLKLPSVGATVNSILLAVSAEGDSRICGCAVEPHIDTLIEFLNSAGGQIVRRGRELYISGRGLHGGKIRVIGDMIEAGSYLALSLMTGEKIKTLNSPLQDMDSVIDAFSDLGADIVGKEGVLQVSLERGRFSTVSASPHPGFPTDLQPIFAPLMANNRGGVIIDNVWQSRFGYLDSLKKFGVKSEVNDNRARIFPSKITEGSTYATDLRGGMAALMCALCASGMSEIYSAELILRGYEELEKKLSSLGADIIIKNIN